MYLNPHNLLRRTFLAVAAVAAVATTPLAHATGTVTKTDGSTLCSSWTTLELVPSGIQINGCVAPGGTVSAPAPAGTFTINGSDTIDASTNEYLWYSVSRAAASGSTAGAATLTLTSTGGCSVSPATVSFADNSGDGSYQVFGLVAPKDASGKIYNTTCVVSIVQQTPALTLGNPSGKSVTVKNGTGTAPGSGPGTVAGCPAIPSGSVANFPIRYGGNDLPYMQSGQIGYTTLPKLASWGGSGTSGKVVTAITTGSANGTVEISISKCPGVIDTTGAYSGGATGGSCYKQVATDGSLHSLTWFEAPGSSPAATDSLATTYGICEAYASKGTWYVSVRYNFTDPAPPGQANYLFQYQYDYYAP